MFQYNKIIPLFHSGFMLVMGNDHSQREERALLLYNSTIAEC